MQFRFLLIFFPITLQLPPKKSNGSSRSSGFISSESGGRTGSRLLPGPGCGFACSRPIPESADGRHRCSHRGHECELCHHPDPLPDAEERPVPWCRKSAFAQEPVASGKGLSSGVVRNACERCLNCAPRACALSFAIARCELRCVCKRVARAQSVFFSSPSTGGAKRISPAYWLQESGCFSRVATAETVHGQVPLQEGMPFPEPGRWRLSRRLRRRGYSLAGHCVLPCWGQRGHACSRPVSGGHHRDYRRHVHGVQGAGPRYLSLREPTHSFLEQLD